MKANTSFIHFESSHSRREFLKTGIMAGSLSLMPGNVPALQSAQSASGEKALPPGVNPADPLLALGILDVTKPPYSADPAGSLECTQAIQQAANDARDFGLVCFFPEGTYLISDTISCEVPVTKLDEPRHVDGGTQHYWTTRQPFIIMGSTKGNRPVLKLSRQAQGFDDPGNPKFAFYIWAQTWMDAPGKEEPEWGKEQPNINFNHIFKGIDIDIRGHRGAIGIRFSGAQGATMQDVAIHADGAYAGLSDCPGQGGGTHNVSVVGGRYGILIDSNSRFPVLNGCEFTEQTECAIRFEGASIQVPTLLVGCRIEVQGSTVVDMTAGNSYGGITLVDTIINLQRGGVCVKTRKSENIFLENVYLRGAESVYPGGSKLPAPRDWMLIERYSSHDNRCVNLVNGAESTGEVAQWAKVSTVPSFQAQHDRHYSRTPSFEDDGVVNVRSFGAAGDGETDDTDAFRKAVASGDKIFVPKGNFKLSGALQLRPSTQMFGLSRTFSSFGTISADPSRSFEALMGVSGQQSAGRQEARPETEPFTLCTADDINAAPGLFFLGIHGRVEWSAGQGVWMLASGTPVFSARGGGRFYALGSVGRPLILEGIRQPTSFYALNVERVTTDPQSEIRNCRSVRIYYFKVEAGTIPNLEDQRDANTPCRIIDSQDIRIYCNYGNVKGLGDRPMLDVMNSSDVVVSQLKAFRESSFPHVRETQGTRVYEIPSTKICALFVRD